MTHGEHFYTCVHNCFHWVIWSYEENVVLNETDMLKDYLETGVSLMTDLIQISAVRNCASEKHVTDFSHKIKYITRSRLLIFCPRC